MSHTPLARSTSPELRPSAPNLCSLRERADRVVGNAGKFSFSLLFLPPDFESAFPARLTVDQTRQPGFDVPVMDKRGNESALYGGLISRQDVLSEIIIPVVRQLLQYCHFADFLFRKREPDLHIRWKCIDVSFRLEIAGGMKERA